ncbi:MAG: phosphatase PAP2 family protein [Janthinobacterium lividum]
MTYFWMQFDQHWFHQINHDWSNPLFDVLMPIFRNPKTWIPLYLFIIGFSIFRYRKVAILIIALLAATAGTADFVCVRVIKAYVKRVRPCNDPKFEPTVINRVPCGTGLSFPSAHASDHFAIAIFLCMAFGQNWRWIWFFAVFWAALICYAQVYVGVHYPIDVLTGAAFGALVGLLYGLVYKRFYLKFS